MKVLNLYAGLGGNRKLWEDVEVVAIEIDPEIAEIYQKHFPDDEVIVTHAQTFLRTNFKKFDFIWSSPPCPSHSKVRMMASKSTSKGSYEPIFPNLTLYEEILFLKHFFDGFWVVENVKPFYKPLIRPTTQLHRHIFWSNFLIPHKKFDDNMSHNERGYIKDSWFDLSRYNFSHRKDRIIRNSVNPDIGKFILDCARKQQQKTLKSVLK